MVQFIENLVVRQIRIESATGVGASLSIENDTLLLDVDQQLGAISMQVPGGDVRIKANGLIRLDAARLELHAVAVLRLDAGGSGATFHPDRWDWYLPQSGGGWMPAPPEHPDTGGETYRYGATLSSQPAPAGPPV